MAKNDDCHVTPKLAECVREAGREILAMGRNPKFVKEHGETMTDLDDSVAAISICLGKLHTPRSIEIE